MSDSTTNPLNVESGSKKARRIFPLMATAAEQLVSAYCMSRNIMTFPAPPRNEGYDLVCVHPDPRKVANAFRIQVKSRYQTDCNEVFDFHPKSLGAFNFYAAVFLNCGFYFSRKKFAPEGLCPPEIFIVPHDYVAKHYIRRSKRSGMKIGRADPNLQRFQGFAGVQLIADALVVPYPS